MIYSIYTFLDMLEVNIYISFVEDKPRDTFSVFAGFSSMFVWSNNLDNCC